MNKKVEKILSVPKSFWVSLHFFRLKDALKLPFFVRYNCVLKNLSGDIKINSGGVKTAMFHFGFNNVGIFDKKYERSILDIQGRVEINGKVDFGHGSRLVVCTDGMLSLGKNFVNTAKGTIVCTKHITIGENMLMSWDTLIMDTDWHSVQDTITGTIYPSAKEIIIGNGVWMGMRSVILKGAIVADGCVIAANALCCHKYIEPNCLLAGVPAEVKKHNITKKI